jgi:hypothetical protein
LDKPLFAKIPHPNPLPVGEGTEKMTSSAVSKPVRLAVRHSSFCLFFLLWLLFMVAGRSSMFRDPGTFWHLSVGNNIIAAKRLPQTDTYTFTRDGRYWIADQWLAEIAMAGIHHAAGWDGLSTVTAAVLAGIYTFITVRLSRAGVHWLLAGAILAVTLLASSHQFHARPLIISLAGLGIAYCLIIDVEAGRKSLHKCWLLAPMFILWANMHGGVLAGMGCAGLCVLGWLLLRAAGKESPIHNFRQALETTLLMMLIPICALINPYGMNMVREWFGTLSLPLSDIIEEHGILEITSPAGWATMCLGMIYAIVLLGVLPRRPRIAWLMPLVFFALALRVRNAPLFAITAVLAISDMMPYSRLTNWLKRRRWISIPAETLTAFDAGRGVRDCQGHVPAQLGNALAPVRTLLLPIGLVCTALLIQFCKIPAPVFGAGWARFDPAVWPMELLPKLYAINDKTPTREGRIFNDMKFGGFLIYHAPRLKIFVDDRCVLYGEEFLLAYDSARRRDPGQIESWQRRYQFGYALVESDGLFDRYLRGEGRWSLLGRSPAAALYGFNLGFSDDIN